jgi:hypothetical protein
MKCIKVGHLALGLYLNYAQAEFRARRI